MSEGEKYTKHMDPNLSGPNRAMEYNAAGLPALRVIGNNLGWGIQVSNGEIEGVSYIEKFGMNPDVDSDKETIWGYGGLYQYQTVSTTITVTSDSSDDGPGLAGAHNVEIQGLDENWEVVTETINLGATGSQQFIRVFRATVINSGSIGTNAGNILLSCSVTANVLAEIGVDGGGAGAGRGQTFMALYTIPAGKTGYLTQWTVGAGKQNTDAIAFIMQRNPLDPSDGAWTAKDIITVSATTYKKDYMIPIRIPEKHDIEVRAYSGTNNSLVSSTFNLILIDNDNP